MINVLEYLSKFGMGETALQLEDLAQARAKIVEDLERSLSEERTLLEFLREEIRRRAPEKHEISLIGFARFLQENDQRLLELFDSCEVLNFGEERIVLKVAKENRAFFSIFQPALESALKLYAGKSIALEPRFK